MAAGYDRPVLEFCDDLPVLDAGDPVLLAEIYLQLVEFQAQGSYGISGRDVRVLLEDDRQLLEELGLDRRLISHSSPCREGRPGAWSATSGFHGLQWCASRPRPVPSFSTSRRSSTACAA